MKWSRTYLDNLKSKTFSFEDDPKIDLSDLPATIRLRSLKDLHVSGNCQYDDYLEILKVNVTITGTMVVPCAMTDKDVDYPFNESEEVLYSFSDLGQEDAIIVSSNEINLDEFIRDLVIVSIPTQVISKDYKSVEKKEEKTIDPRFAKLKDFKID